MRPETEALFNDAILSEAASRFGVARETLKNLGGFESFVYEYDRDDKAYILKGTHSIRRTASYILSELDFINYLAERGVSVARAIPSNRGDLLEIVPADDGTHFLVYAFEKAPGARATRDDASLALWESWGQTLGQMHALAKDYTPPDSVPLRMEWHQEDLFDLPKHLPPSPLRHKCEQFLQKLHEFSRDADAYGLVHADLHPGNFHLYQGGIIAFDFDDAHYHWFAADIAIALYNMDIFVPEGATADERATFLSTLVKHFLRGYYRANHLDPIWLPRIHNFWRLRTITYFALIHREWGITNLEPWVQRWFDKLTHELENDFPHFDIE